MLARRQVTTKKRPEPGEVSLYVDIISCWRESKEIRRAFGSLDEYVRYREDRHFCKYGIVRLENERVRLIVERKGAGGRESPGTNSSTQGPAA